MKKSLLKDSIRQIKNTYKRFLSLLLIVLLGVGFFAGIRATSPDMKDTIDTYFDEKNVMDVQVMSTLGLTGDDVNAISNIEGVGTAVGAYSFDATFDSGENEYVVKIQSIPEGINQLQLVDGSLPQNSDECVVEPALLTRSDYKIGDYIELTPEETDVTNSVVDDTEEEENTSSLKNNKVKIVGTVKSPEYISSSRGTSKLGSGSVDFYMYVTSENVNMDVYTTIFLTVDGAKELKTYDEEYENKVEEIKDKIEAISEERKQIRYDEIVGEATDQLNEAQAEFDKQKQEADSKIADAQKQIDNAKAELESGRQELAENRSSAQREFANADKQISDAQTQIDNSKTQLESKRQETNSQIESAEENLANLQNVKTQYDNLVSQKSGINTQLIQINASLEELNKNPEENAEKIKELTTTKATLEASLKQIDAGISTIESTLSSQGISVSNLDATIEIISSQISSAKQELIDAENQINSAQQELDAQKEELEKTKSSTNSQLANAQETLDQAEIEISENEQKLEEERVNAQEQLDEAQAKLNDARTQISKIERPTWYILDRNSNYGYVEYIQDTDRIDNLAQVFPVVFFLVAALMSLTSMSRMIEEQRVQIGTLKALGYNKLQISMKYVIYALLATILGGILGMIIGFKLIPSVITMMYAMMYEIPEADCIIRLDIGLVGIGFALIATLGATIYTCAKELKEKPANLMLPRAPKPGKRILLEHIPFIWKRLKFTNKVTARNVFRYKKKMLMTVIGVCGCTSLIIAGFGIRSAIGNMIPNQYDEIFLYDGSLEFQDDVTTTQIQEENEKVRAQEKIADTLTTYMNTVEITSIDNAQTINLVVTDQIDNFDNFIKLKSRTNKKETYTLSQDTVILSEKIATLLDINVGDTITIKNADDIEKDVKVGAITENYLYHYMYMSSTLYNNLYGENSYKPNTILIKEADGTTTQDEENIGRTLLENKDIVSGVTFLSNTKDIFSEVMDRMGLVVYVLIIAAGLLAFAVLYNLSNVNISERIRELATIKVLGFYNGEVFNYITKETRILTVMGIILGLLGGYFLSMYAVKTCELDMLMFNYNIGIMCFVWGIVITVVFAEIVNIAVNHTLKKISMADSLKSVD